MMTNKRGIAAETASPRNDNVCRGRFETGPVSGGQSRAGFKPAPTGFLAVIIFAAMMRAGGMGMAAEVAGVGATAATVELPSKLKEVTGIVIARTRFNMSVETSRQGSSAMEMVLPYDKTTKLRGYRHFDEIARGDTIKAVCKQTYEVQKDGSERIMGTVAAQISLVKSSSQGRLTSKER